MMPLQRLDDRGLLGRFADGRERERAVLGGGGQLQVVGLDHAVFAHGGGVADAVDQFAHVAGPVVLLDRAQRHRREAADACRRLLAHAVQHVFGDQQDVAAAFAQRWLAHAQHAQPVVEVAAEAFGGDRGFQVDVGGGDDAHVHVHRFGAAQPLDAAGFQEAKQAGLAFDRHVADFIEEQGAALCHLDAAGLALGCAGEGAALIAEQL
ncbi:hypothetical protein FQZ97_208050 [compost metagenome]